MVEPFGVATMKRLTREQENVARDMLESFIRRSERFDIERAREDRKRRLKQLRELNPLKYAKYYLPGGMKRLVRELEQSE